MKHVVFKLQFNIFPESIWTILETKMANHPKLYTIWNGLYHIFRAQFRIVPFPVYSIQMYFKQQSQLETRFVDESIQWVQLFVFFNRKVQISQLL